MTDGIADGNDSDGIDGIDADADAGGWEEEEEEGKLKLTRLEKEGRNGRHVIVQEIRKEQSREAEAEDRRDQRKDSDWTGGDSGERENSVMHKKRLAGLSRVRMHMQTCRHEHIGVHTACWQLAECRARNLQTWIVNSVFYSSLEQDTPSIVSCQ